MAATQLWLVRHGESTANVAATAAEIAGLDVIDAETRDADVPLSETGIEQATALGRWLGSAHPTPDTVWCSPYLRAEQTTTIALHEAGFAPGSAASFARVDERLRDRELGVLDLLTSHGVANLFASEEKRRSWLGKFYYRPPGGESWADVALRLRSALPDIVHGSSGTVLVVAHDAIVLLMLYICTGMRESELLDFAQTHTVANASVTRLSRPSESESWTLDEFSGHDHLEAFGAPVTRHPGDRDVQPE